MPSSGPESCACQSCSAVLTLHVLFDHYLSFDNCFKRGGEWSIHTHGARRSAWSPYFNQHPGGKIKASLPQHVDRCLVPKVGVLVQVMAYGLKAHHSLQLCASNAPPMKIRLMSFQERSVFQHPYLGVREGLCAEGLTSRPVGAGRELSVIQSRARCRPHAMAAVMV